MCITIGFDDYTYLRCIKTADSHAGTGTSGALYVENMDTAADLPHLQSEI